MNTTPAIFADDQHRELYSSTLDRMESTDCYHRAAAYLLSLDNVLRDHMTAVFDFSEDVIKPEGMNAAFQTSTSRKTSRLLWNLWNGYDGNEELNEDGEPTDPTRYYTPENLFNCSYLPYYLEAVRIRFEIFMPED